MNEKDVQSYLDSLPVESRKQLTELRKIIKVTAKDAVESISYGMPSYKYKEKPLAYFAGFKNHISFFPMPSVMKKFKNELQNYTTTKAAMHIPIGNKLQKSLIQKMIKERMKEIDELTNTKKD